MENKQVLALQASGVCHTYGRGEAKCEVLKGLTLAVGAGEFVALMGPSGSGKSTFLHLAAGLLVPASGTIDVGGKCVTSMGDGAASRFRRRHEGIVFQDFNLLASLTVAENVVLAARLDHAKPDWGRVKELLGRLGLADKENRRPAELSGGEQQRVAIARALYARPEIVLADEPTGNLDTQAARGICEALKELNATEKSAILLVTHDPVVAATASRVCFLKSGVVAVDFATEHNAELISKRYLECYQ